MTKVLNILLCTIIINSCFIKNSFSFDDEDLQKLLKNNVCINCDLSGADFRKKDLILLKVNTLKLDQLLWEQASDGNMFPHLYSPLNLSNVVDEFKISLREDGSHILPDNF